MGGEEKIGFVDVFPPRYRLKSGPLVEWPEPHSSLGRTLGYFKHYDVRGIILCFLSQLGRANPTLRASFESMVLGSLDKLLSEKERVFFVQGFEQTSWKKVRSLLSARSPVSSEDKRHIITLIKGASHEQVFGYPYYVYGLREIALELASARLIKNHSF